MKLLHPQYTLLCLFSLLMGSCVSIRPVEYKSIDHFTVTNLATAPEFSVNVNMYNPNTIGAKLKDFSLEFYLSDVQLSVLFLEEVSRVPPRQQFTLPVSGFTSLSQVAVFLPSGIFSYVTGSEIPVTVKGSVTVKKFIFSRRFPFEYHDVLRTDDVMLQ